MLFRTDVFGWIRSQQKCLFLLGTTRGGRSSPWIGFKEGDDNSLTGVFCGCEEENANHIILHCTVVKSIWEITLAIFGVQWVFPESVLEVLLSWRGSFVRKKRKKIWNSIPLCIFWTVWKEKNRLAFRGGSLDIQKFKNFFVCNLWSWARVYIGEETYSLLGFLEWLAAT